MTLSSGDRNLIVSALGWMLAALEAEERLGRDPREYLADPAEVRALRDRIQKGES